MVGLHQLAPVEASVFMRIFYRGAVTVRRVNSPQCWNVLGSGVSVQRYLLTSWNKLGYLSSGPRLGFGRLLLKPKVYGQ